MSLESELGVRIIALKRKKKWIYDPEDEMKLREGDRIIIRGVEDGFILLKKLASGEISWENREEADKGVKDNGRVTK